MKGGIPVDHKPESIHSGKAPHFGYQTQNDTGAYLSLAVLFAVLFAAIVLFGRELVMSMKDGNLARGLADAPWVGFRNYEELLSSVAFASLLRNTFAFNFLFAGMSFAFAVLLGYLFTALPKMLKGVLAVFFGLLVLLPDEVFAGWVIRLAGSELLINPGAMRFLHPLICSVKYLGIPLLLIYLKDEIYLEKDSLTPVKAAGLFSLASLIFLSSSFFTLTKALYNPLNYETMDMLDTYAFRKGMLEINAGLNAAIGIIQILITVVSAAILFVPVLALFRSTFKGERKDASGDSIFDRLVPSIIAFILFAAAFFLPYMFKGYSFDLGQLSRKVNLFTPIVNFLLVSVLSAMIATAFAAAISKSFFSANRGIKIMAAALLAVITILNINPYKYSSYLLLRNLGLVNTVYAIIASTCFSAAAVWAMACMLHSDRTSTGNSLFLSSLALLLIQTALVYRNSTPQIIYLVRPQVSPLLILSQLSRIPSIRAAAADRTSFIGIMGLYGFLASLPPMLLFLATYIFLPKDKLLAIISAGVNN
jgi:ABC-type glycerol-3-phosphate transport system permease component